MDKEDIEKVKKHYIFTTEHELDDNNKTLKEYIEYLEQKEFILDKVTEFVTKIATENAEKYNSENQKEVDFSEWNLALEILNIIEGEKK